MKILPTVYGIKNEIVSSTKRMKEAAGRGYVIAERKADINKQGKIQKYYNITKSIKSEIIKNSNKNDIPYIAGAFGMLIPFPLFSPILMGLGYIARYLLNKDNNENKSLT